MATFLILDETKKQELDILLLYISPKENCAIVPVPREDGTYILPADLKQGEEYRGFWKFLDSLEEAELPG